MHLWPSNPPGPGDAPGIAIIEGGGRRHAKSAISHVLNDMPEVRANP